MMSFARPQLPALVRRMREPRRFIQVLAGPRQVGKTTLARQVLDQIEGPTHFASADRPGLRPEAWLDQQWALGRIAAQRDGAALLVLDEVQKLPGWSESVKLRWDEDTAAGLDLRVLLLGSAPLLLQQGLTESLAGRFEVTRVAQWSLAEMREAFGWDLPRYIYFGGYPGAASLVEDESRWAHYVRDALIETTVSRDILLMQRVEKPALLRQLFSLGCAYSGQILAYNKMLGQLHDAGNTTTLAHYLNLLGGAGLVSGLAKFTDRVARQRASSPKLQVHDTGLISASGRHDFAQAQADPEHWGRLVESAVGAHLLHTTAGTNVEVTWWRDRADEVDFVLQHGDRVVPIEVKSGRATQHHAGTAEFARRHVVHRTLLVGGQGVPVEEFLQTPASEWVR